jgi:hypothetical protein
MNESLVSLDKLQAKVEDMTEDEKLYLLYFKAYSLKKMGFLFDAREMLLSLVDSPLTEQIRFKVLVKLAKIYTDL